MTADSPNEEELRKLLKPDPSVQDILEVVRKSFVAETHSPPDIQVVKELESYDDKNLWISIDGINFLVKVHNGVESKDLMDSLDGSGFHKTSAIHLQNAMMMHLNQNGITTNQPQAPVHAYFPNHTMAPTPASLHSLPVVSKEHSPCRLIVRLLGWVDGRPMSSFEMLPIEALADAGRFLGNMSKCLSTLPTQDLKAAKRYHQWDGKNTLDLRDFVQYIDDDSRKTMVTNVIDTFQTELIDTGVAETYFQKSLIHGDFNDANFLLNGDFRVSGVIDFGDSVESWRILDLSIAMAYAMLTVYGKQNRSLAAAAAMLRGYNAVCPLTPEERKHLLLLVASRLTCSVTLGAYSYKQNPGNKYLLLHATPAWDALDLIWGTDEARRASMREAIDGLFDLACSKSGVAEDGKHIDCSDLAFPDPAVKDPFSSVRI